ncbi:MAG: rod shape-determining protein MreC [Evtepia sp.]
MIVSLCLTIIVMVASAFYSKTTMPLSNLAGIIATPVERVIGMGTRGIETIYRSLFDYEAMEKENQALREEVAKLRQQARDGSVASQENIRLRELLSLREKRSDFEFEPAKIIASSSTNWNRAVTIDKGLSQGVAVDDCVIDSTGALVGVISEVGQTWSTLLTTIDSGLQMGGQVVRTGTVAVLEGDFSLMSEGLLKLSYLPADVTLMEGDEVLTYGTEGMYPTGLPVGIVQEVRTDSSGLTKFAVLKPTVAVDKMVQVFVIKSFQIID